MRVSLVMSVIIAVLLISTVQAQVVSLSYMMSASEGVDLHVSARPEARLPRYIYQQDFSSDGMTFVTENATFSDRADVSFSAVARPSTRMTSSVSYVQNTLDIVWLNQTCTYAAVGFATNGRNTMINEEVIVDDEQLLHGVEATGDGRAGVGFSSRNVSVRSVSRGEYNVSAILRWIHPAPPAAMPDKTVPELCVWSVPSGGYPIFYHGTNRTIAA